MCGILGLVSKDPIDRGHAHAALDLIAHRGPDGDNAWHDSADNVWFGHRRLSIIDLSHAGDQPMHSADGRFVLYEDDGDTFDYRKGRYRLTEFRWDDAARRLSVAPLAGPSDPLPPEPRRYTVRVAGGDGAKTLHHDGRTAVSLTI